MAKLMCRVGDGEAINEVVKRIASMQRWQWDFTQNGDRYIKDGVEYVVPGNGCVELTQEMIAEIAALATSAVVLDVTDGVPAGFTRVEPSYD